MTRAAVSLIAALACVAPMGGRAQTQPAQGLRIVVIEGENAVNIIQQKTAVAPVVEVRDRNDQPVAGAVVRFAIRNGKATFGGSKALVVTTNTAGRAAVTTLTPTGSGALQISATAAFQGQTAAVTIAQTNVMTAAAASGAAAGAGGSASGSTAAGGGASAGGGGLSATTIAVVGGAAAGGVLVATKVLGKDSTHYSGPFSGVSVATFPACSTTSMHTGTVGLDIKTADGGTVTGTGDVSETRTVSQSTCGAFPVGSSQSDGCCDPSPQVQGTTANMTFSSSHSGGSGTNWTYAFSGAQNGAEIVGTFTLTVTSPTDPTIVASFPVTLR